MTTTPDSPTIVLVHGALTDASVWHDVIPMLQQHGYTVLAPALPMRSLTSDAHYLHSLLTTLAGPIVLAGHSYGGSVISHPDAITPAVRSLVFIAAFQQDADETAGELNYRFPGSQLVPDTTVMRDYPGGSELYLRPEHFAEVYADDVDSSVAAVMAAAQHPIDPTALGETFPGTPTWRTLSSWTLICVGDRSIPTEAQRFMADRAGSTVIEVESSHAVPRSHPAATAEIVLAAI